MLLRKFCGIEKTDNGYLIHGDAGDIKLVFMTDDIIRIRVSFDRKFKEASYALVTTAWEDELDELFQEERTRIQAKDVVCEEKEDALIFHTTALKLVMKKQPIQFLLYDAEGKLIYNDLKERAFDQDQLGRVTHYSEIHADTDHFYGFGEKTGQIRNLGSRCTNMFHFIFVSMKKIFMRWDCFTIIPMTLYLIWEMSEADIGTVTVIIRRMAEISTCF